MKTKFLILLFVFSALLLTGSVSAQTPYAPSISYISPTSVTAGGSIYVYGSNFDQSSYVVLDGASPSIVPASQTNTSLSFVVPSNVSPGSHSIQVGIKAAPLSNSVSLTVVVPASAYTPAISYISPSSVVSGGTVMVYGSNFDQSSYVVIDGNYPSIVPSSQTNSSLNFVVPSNVNPGSHLIQVGVKAAPLSNSVSLTVMVPASAYTPVISSINPTSVTAGGTVVVYGSNFDQSSYVVLDGTYPSIVPTYQAGTYLSFVVPSNTNIGSHAIQVGVKAAPLSNSMSFNVASTQSTPIPTPTPTPQPNATPLPADVDTQNPQGACLDLQANLRYRMRDTTTSDDISSFQDYLQANGYLHTEPTGFFGVLTLKAVKDFQQASGISPTGFVGPITRAKIKALSCQ